MSVKYAILGLLSRSPATGYELKKVFEESPVFYWSGNNNQIYKTLLQLTDEGLATNEVLHRDGSPSKKVYTITEEGLRKLREWVASPPETPEFRNQFLIRLAWAHLLDDNELAALLSQYETEVKTQLLMRQEQVRRELESRAGNPQEARVWEMIAENLVSACKSEMEWIKVTRNKLLEEASMEERDNMNYRICESGVKKYVELISVLTPVNTENEALDLVALCGQNDTSLLMIHGEALSDDFFSLGTGVAGMILQKFINYSIRTALVLPGGIRNKGRFREMALEANRGSHFRVFDNRESAEKWLLG